MHRERQACSLAPGRALTFWWACFYWSCLPWACSLWACGPIVLGDARETDLPGEEPEPPGEPPGEPPEPPAGPQKGEVTWSATHESGDFSEWERGGPSEGGQYYWGTGSGRVTTEMSRTGARALELTIDTTGVSPSDGARVYRRLASQAAFYESWLRLETEHTTSDWWAIVVFHARDAALSPQNVVQLWDLRLVESSAGVMTLQFFDHAAGAAVTASEEGVIIPGEWFHLETYVDYRPPQASEVRVWLNGRVLFDMSGLVTSHEEHVFWLVGNGGAELSPSASKIFVDDAAISDVLVNP